MSILERNLLMLKALQPDMAKIIENCKPSNPSRVQFGTAKNGMLTASILGEKNGWFPVTSNYDPLYEAEQRTSILDFSRCFFTVVLGSGLGYAIQSIFEKQLNPGYVICVEPNVELLRLTFEHVDLTSLLSTYRLAFLTGNEEQLMNEFGRICSSIIIFRAGNPSFIHLPQTKVEYQDLYKSLPSKLIEHIKLSVHNITGDVIDTLQGVEQTIFNLDEFFDNPIFPQIDDFYEGVPIFVVSTGPSLDKNVEQLKRVRGKGLIFCAESAAIPLMKKGITPDGVFILERFPQSYDFHIKGIEYPQESVLFALMLVVPPIFDEWKGLKVPVFPIADTYTRGIHELLDVQGSMYSGISAANMAFSMARHLKAGRIIFVGQDLAYGQEGRSHSDHSHYGNTKGKQEVDAELVYVKDYQGHEIPSTLVWLRYLRWFEQQIKQTNAPVIDATEGGAFIEGTKLMTLKDVVDEYCVKDLPLPFHEYIASLKERKIYSAQEKIEYVDKILNYLDEIKTCNQDILDAVLKEIDAMKRNRRKIDKHGDSVKVDPIVKRVLKSQQVLKQIEDGELVRFMFQIRLMSLAVKAEEIGTIDDVDKLKQMLQLLEHFYNLIIISERDMILPVIENCIRRLHEYREILTQQD